MPKLLLVLVGFFGSGVVGHHIIQGDLSQWYWLISLGFAVLALWAAKTHEL